MLNPFDTSIEMVKASDFQKKSEAFPKTILFTFHQKFYKMVKDQLGGKIIKSIFGGQDFPIYSFDYNGHHLGLIVSPLGGPASAAFTEELIVLGAQKIIYFGSCGSLSKQTKGKLIIPTKAFRDEGTSYHYQPSSDWQDVPTYHRLEELFTQKNIPFISGPTWTTDAFYRETKNLVELMKQKGCICVEMECASLMACCALRNIEAYQFLYTADRMDGDTWQIDKMFHQTHKDYTLYLEVALMLATSL